MSDQSLKNEEWNRKRLERNARKRKPLSKWHAFRLRILQEKNDYASFIQYIKWKRGIVLKEEDYDDEIEFLDKMKEEFRSLGGYEFFEEHNLDLPPCGIGGYESSFFD